MSRIFLFAAALMLAPPAAAETSYFQTIADLPLAPGLHEGEGAFAFDGARGHMIGVAAHGVAEMGAVRSFYMDTLPQLGWAFVPMGAAGGQQMHFQRGREDLTLEVRPHGTELELNVRLVSQPASNAD